MLLHNPRYRSPAVGLTAYQTAQRDGYLDGIADRHTTARLYRTSREWTAWLTGWRKGQQRLKRARRAA